MVASLSIILTLLAGIGALSSMLSLTIIRSLDFFAFFL